MTTTPPTIQNSTTISISVQPSSHKPSFHTTAFFYYHTFSNISYFLLLTPYRTVLVANEGQQSRLVINTNLFQKSTTSLLHTLASFFVLLFTISSHASHRHLQNDPTSIFSLATNSLFSIAFAIFLHIVWFKGEDGIRALYEVCHGHLVVEPEPGSWVRRERLLPLLLTAFSVYLSLSNLLQGQTSLSTQLSTAKALILPYTDPHWLLDWIVTALILVYMVYMSLLSHFVLIVFPDMACCALHAIGDSCRRFLEEQPDLSLTELLTYTASLRTLTTQLNATTSSAIFIFVGNALTNLTSALLEILDSGSVPQRVAGCLYSSGFVVMILAAAEGARRMETLSDYVYQRSERPSYKENVDALVLLTELSSNPLALKCFKFPVTYGFVVTIISTGLTYSIILLQFKVASSAAVDG